MYYTVRSLILENCVMHCAISECLLIGLLDFFCDTDGRCFLLKWLVSLLLWDFFAICYVISIMYYCRQWNGVLSRRICKGEQWCHYLWLSSISPFTPYFTMSEIPEVVMVCCLVGVLASALKRNVILFLTFLTFWVVFGILMCSTWCLLKLSNTCAIWSYNSSAGKDSSLLGYCTVSIGNDLSSRLHTPASHIPIRIPLSSNLQGAACFNVWKLLGWETFRLLFVPKVHCRVNKVPPMDHTLNRYDHFLSSAFRHAPCPIALLLMYQSNKGWNFQGFFSCRTIHWSGPDLVVAQWL